MMELINMFYLKKCIVIVLAKEHLLEDGLEG
jgi:hypothetical protein